MGLVPQKQADSAFSTQAPEQGELCKHCIFWVAANDQPRNRKAIADGDGECRRRAPVGGGITAFFAAGKRANKMISTIFPWPITNQGDWCGEFISALAPPSRTEERTTGTGGLVP